MTEYSLPSLVTAVGEFKFTLYSDIAGMTPPTDQTIVNIGELSEVMDLDIGLGQFSTLTISIADDYTTYTEGFWYKVLNDNWRLRIYLVQSVADVFYFFGIPQEERVIWSEHYIQSTTRIRTAQVTMVSIEAVLFTTPTADWLEAVYAVRRTAVNTATSTIYEAVSIKDMFSALLSASGLNTALGADKTGTITSTGTAVAGSSTLFTSELRVGDQIASPSDDASPQIRTITVITDDTNLTVSEAFSPDVSGEPFALRTLPGTPDVDIVYHTADFVYTEGANDWDVDQLYIPVTVSSSSVVTKTKYFDPAEADYLGNHYPTAAGLFSAMCRNFGLVAHASYVPASEKHFLQLLQRVQSSSAYFVGTGDEMESQIAKAFTLLGDAARAAFLLNPSVSYTWFSKKFSMSLPLATEPPNYVEFDLDITLPFIESDAVIATDRAGYALHGGAAITSAALIDGVEYYNYNTDAFVVASVGNPVLEAAAGYEFFRFSNKFSRITRRYQTLTPSDASDQSDIRIGIETTINDGTGDSTYFANKVTKIPEEIATEIEWIKE